jgi:CHAT domain-containing protein
MKKTVAILFFIGATAVVNFSYSQLWKAYSDSAKIFRDQKKNDEAITYYNKAKAILAIDSIYSNAFSQTCINIADVYNITGQKNKVIPFYQEARQSIEKTSGKENVAYVAVTDRLGQAYMSVNPPDAEAYFIEAKEIQEKQFGKESLEYARCCNSLGILYSTITGQLKKAELFHLEAKRIREAKLPRDHPDYARSCNNLAYVYYNMGEYEKAEPLALEAKRIREKVLGKENRDYAITCINLGNIYLKMGQYEKAEVVYNEGKIIREKLFGKQHDDYLATLIVIANLYSYMGAYEKAEPLYAEVKQTRGEIDKKSSDYALSCNNLGSLYTEMHQYEKAELLLTEARDIWNKVIDKDNSLNAFNRNSLGQLYFAMEQYQKAASYFLEARQLWEKVVGKEHADYIQNTNDLARVYWNLDQPVKANELYVQAFNAQYNQVNKIFQFTSETEKELYIKNVNGTGDEYQSFYYQKISHSNAGAPYTMSLLSRNLILSSSQKLRQVIYNSGDTILINKYNDWTNLKQRLAELYSKGTAGLSEQIREAEEKADQIEKELSRQSSEFKEMRKKISWGNVEQSLKKNEAAIEFVEFRLYDGKQWTDSIFYIALVCRKDIKEPILIPLFEKKKLDNLLNQKFPDEVAAIDHHYSSPALFRLIWRPLEKYLSGISKVYFAPAGNLFRVSFGALVVNDKQVLSDKYRLIQLNTTATVVGQEQSFITHSDKIQVYGGIDYDADTAALKKAIVTHHSITTSRSLPGEVTRGKTFQYLPGTMEEAEAIKKQADKTGATVSVLSGINASEESFDALNGSASPAVLHIATHGFFFDPPKKNGSDSVQPGIKMSGMAFRQSGNPLFRSALLFAGANNTWRGRFVSGIEDGIVTAYEVSNMFLPNTKMVVLSACQTALGDIQGSEGVYGLQRAFKIAGVQNLVMSLWKVPDRETSEFMQEFYKNLFAKESISDSFYNAQTKMKNKYRQEPHKWAAWVLIK